MELKNLRTKLNMSQTDVANALGMSSQRYNKYELGINEPDIETLKKLAGLFNVSIDEIIGYVSNIEGENKYKSLVDSIKTLTLEEIDLTLQFINALKHKG